MAAGKAGEPSSARLGDGADRAVIVVRRDDCSHGEGAIESVKRLARELGLAIRVEDVVVQTADDAKAHRCLGSPTVLVAGNDVEVGARGQTSFGVT